MLDLVNVKSEIENNTFDKKLFICISKYISSDFIFYQYLHTYANKNNLEIQVIEDLDQIIGSIFSIIDDNILYVFYGDKVNYIPNTNFRLWIRCKSLSKEIKDNYDLNILELIKLEDWQIKDYISTKNKISLDESDELIKTYKDLYKLDIESSKLLNNKFNDIKDQLFYEDNNNIFDLVNALVKRDSNTLKNINTSNIDPFGFTALLNKNFKQVIDIQLAKNATAESLGISGKQFWAIKNYSCGRYSRDELLYLYKFLNSIDLKIKTGNLDTSIIVDYIISKFMLFI